MGSNIQLLETKSHSHNMYLMMMCISNEQIKQSLNVSEQKMDLVYTN